MQEIWIQIYEHHFHSSNFACIEYNKQNQRRRITVGIREMNTFSAEDLSTIGGIATVSLLHSFIPTHWLPFSIVGRAQKWTLSRTLFVSMFLSFFIFFFNQLESRFFFYVNLIMKYLLITSP